MCVVVAMNGRAVSSTETIVRNAISTLIKDYRTSDREETEWARAFLELEDASDADIAAQIDLMILVYCPEVPEEYTPFVTEVLAASIRLARRDRALGLNPKRRKIRLETEAMSA